MFTEEIEAIQQRVQLLSQSGKQISFTRSGSSNTTRSKSYNKGSAPLNLDSLNKIHVDPDKLVVHVQPRITMEQLVEETTRFGLMPPVVPEFKGITVGGAIMGCAAESGSHKWGIFSDTCHAYQLILGDGTLIQASEEENQELFHAIPGSYGSLGLLVSATISLIPAPRSVRLRYQRVDKPYTTTDADCLDGIVFDRETTVMVEGSFSDEKPIADRWYFEEAKENKETILPLKTYLFRYDPGAFWMGAYMLKPSFLSRFVAQGLLKFPAKAPLPQKMLDKIHPLPTPSPFWLNKMSSQALWKLHHKAEEWVQERLIIQDFCMPLSTSLRFLSEALEDPALFPIWLCPIKKSPSRQLFAPHDLAEPILNVGLYGLPGHSTSMQTVTGMLEQKTRDYGGKKVLYSRSFYTPEQFWQIYDRRHYEALRRENRAEGIWPDITKKVLSV